jgi:lipid II:glycine glycyltransferase (peptidoglycan interpeptide bridge formation enzyme)
MGIRVIKNKAIWTKYINKLNEQTFLHSLGWKDFNESFGHKVFLLGNFSTNIITSAALVIKIKAKRGHFLLIPHGPQGNLDKKSLTLWTNYLRKLGKKEGCSFIRISPILQDFASNRSLFKQIGYRQAPIHMHAENTTVVDLTHSVYDILLNMRKTTRQLIKKGEKMIEAKDITIKKHKFIDKKLFNTYLSTTKRGKFVPFSINFINQEYKSFSKFEDCQIISVNLGKEVLSWGLFIITKKRCFYHQGANEIHKNIPASYICHWQGMKMAKAKGCISYDFWGVSPNNKPKHPWTNITLFKKGFGGDDLNLVPAQDYIINNKYWITYLIEKFRAKKRGF